MANRRQRAASAAVFCPQNRPPTVDYLRKLRLDLRKNPTLTPFVQAILDLPTTWDLYAQSNSAIAALKQGPEHIRQLRDWIIDDNAVPLVETISGIVVLPLLTIIHITQYFQYLAALEISHAEFLDDIRIGGTQGLCGGLFAAMALAVSHDESEVVENASISLRLALCVGACGELGDDPNNLGPSTIVLRTKHVGQAEDIVLKFPGTYIATVADPYSISVVGPVEQLVKLKAYAQSQGMSTTELHIRGKVHNPENKELCEQLVGLSSLTRELRLPNADSLRVPLRSNQTGDVLRNVPLSSEVLRSTLMTRCNWHSVVTALAKDLGNTGESLHSVVTFGTGRKNCVALEPFEKQGVTLEKVDVVVRVEAPRPRKPAYREESIAVVGASCRLPGANNLHEYWNVIANGEDRHEEIRSDRFDLDGSYRTSLRPDQRRKLYGNFLDQVDNFDNGFFGMSAREAINTDPQQRILLELAYEALESSGYVRTHNRAQGDNVGVFIGASFVEYLDHTHTHPPTAYTSTGTIRAFLCGRLSYYFGWSGPAEVIDTACSASLVAVNRAVRAIQSGECSSALAGGINIITGQNNFLDLGRAGFLSPTGQCKPFDQRGDGYCRADGGGLVFLKSLPRAQQDGDRIMAVIPGSATNQGGLSCALTIPESTALSALYGTVLKQACIPKTLVTYVEAHGTGTQAGDPVEVASIRDVFGDGNRQDKLYLGSVKGNIGHCETAAGVAGLLKVICMLDKGKIPPQASHTTWNPKIPPLQPDGMSLAQTLEPWDAPARAALVNSYGAAGSNAALLCCEPPSVARRAVTTAEKLRAICYPVILSAKSESSLRACQVSLARYLEQVEQLPDIFNISYTLAKRTQWHKYSKIIEAISTQSLIESLKNDDRVNERVEEPDNVILLLGGQHKRSIGLAKELYDRYPYFRAQLNECNAVVEDLGCRSIIPAVFESTEIGDIVTLQAGLVAVEYALAMTWIEAGLKVSAIVGHSLGELAGLAVSGMLTLRDCLKLVVTRASLIQTRWSGERGSMLAIAASKETVHELLALSDLPIDVACYNAPTSQVVAGETAAIGVLEADLQARKPPIKCVRVSTSHAFHSRLVVPILEELDKVSSSLDWHSPNLPIRLCSDGAPPLTLPYSPSAHARNPVFFEATLKRVEEELGKSTWIEVGVNSPIVAMSKRTLDPSWGHSFYTMSMTDEMTRSPTDVVSQTISALWHNSIDVTPWAFIHTSSAESAVWLPPYQFDKPTFWLDNVDHAVVLKSQLGTGTAALPSSVDSGREKTQLVIPLLGDVGQDPRVKRFRVSPQSERFRAIVSGHAMRNQPLCPASLYLECVSMAIATLSPPNSATRLEFEKLDMQAPLGLSCKDIEISIESTAREEMWSFTLSSAIPMSPAKRKLHAQGTVSFAGGSDMAAMERLVHRRIQDFDHSGNAEKLLRRRAYDLFSRVVNYTDFLRGISSVTISGSEAIAKIDVAANQPAQDESTVVTFCEAVAMDNFIQVVGLLMNTSDMIASNEVMVCSAIEHGVVSEKCDMVGQKSWTVYAAYCPLSPSQATGDVFVFAGDGSFAAAFTGCQFTKLEISRLERALGSVNDTAEQLPASQQPLPLRPQVSRLDSLPPLSTGSDTSSVPSDPPSPGGVDALLGVLQRFTGAVVSAVSDKTDLVDMGVDSLAAIELATELAGSFQVAIDGADLLGMTVGELRGHIKLPPGKKPQQV